MFWFYSRRRGKIVEDKIVVLLQPVDHLGMVLIVEGINMENALVTVIHPAQEKQLDTD